MSKFESEDFTVTLQPFFTGISSPDKVNTIFGETADLSLFAPDCFHFSQKSNALSKLSIYRCYFGKIPIEKEATEYYVSVANALWNNMLEPVGNKTRGWRPLMKNFLCPSEKTPYFFTKKNSEIFYQTGHQ